jgi:hypothetical protein
MHGWRHYKHLVLLFVTIGGLMLQPLTRFAVHGLVLFELFVFALMLFVFLAVFERRNERYIAVWLGLPTIAANVFGHFATGATTKTASVVAFHVLLVAFLSFAVGVILRGVFRSRRIGADQLIGAFTGYMLAGIAWANLYVVVYLYVPNSFSIAEGLAWQLAEEDTRRFLFEYFSFMTLTTVGFGDVSPLAPMACSLAWLEAMFGQFYVAVFIGQLIGLKLVQPPIAAAH